MKYTLDPRSWEKQTIYRLENGWLATSEWNEFYGQRITRLDSPDRSQYWHASNGLEVPQWCKDHPTLKNQVIALPDFARPWVDSHRTEGGCLYQFVRLPAATL